MGRSTVFRAWSMEHISIRIISKCISYLQSYQRLTNGGDFDGGVSTDCTGTNETPPSALSRSRLVLVITRVEEGSPSEWAELKEGQGGVGRNRREDAVMRVLNLVDVKGCATPLLDRGGFYFHLLTAAVLVLVLKGRDLHQPERSL
jgi:hypothetical protein